MEIEEKKKEILKDVEQIEKQLNNWKCVDKTSLYGKDFKSFEIIFEQDYKNIKDYPKFYIVF